MPPTYPLCFKFSSVQFSSSHCLVTVGFCAFSVVTTLVDVEDCSSHFFWNVLCTSSVRNSSGTVAKDSSEKSYQDARCDPNIQLRQESSCLGGQLGLYIKTLS